MAELFARADPLNPQSKYIHSAWVPQVRAAAAAAAAAVGPTRSRPAAHHL